MGAAAGDGSVDVVITEIGGTVGDIESLPFLEAARQVRHDVGRDNCFFMHVSLVPYIGPSGELKTKPTQHSVAALRSIGIQPDAIVCRADRELPDGIKRKISLMCDVDEEAVVTAADAPVDLRHPEGAAPRGPRRLRRTPARPALPRRRLDRLGRPAAPGAPPQGGGHGRAWSASTSTSPTPTCRSPRRCAPAASPTRRRCTSAGSPPTTCETPVGRRQAAHDVDAVCVPGGFGVRGIEGKLGALTYARTHSIPTLGLCLGPAVHGHRVRPQRRRAREGRLHRVRPRQPRAGHRDHGGAEVVRRGRGRPRRHDAAGALPGRARRRHRGPRGIRRVDRRTSGTGTATRSTTTTATSSARRAWCSPGTNPDLGLVEFVELPRDVHPYYVATQAHPELRSRPTRPHPLFAGPGRGRDRATEGRAVPARRDRPAPPRGGRRARSAGSRRQRARSHPWPGCPRR